MPEQHQIGLDREVKQPSSPDEAREWLQGAADYLSAVPNASNRLRFVGRALTDYLKGDRKGEQSLRQALGLVPQEDTKRNAGNQPVSLVEVREISKMLCEKATVQEIVTAVGRSKETVHDVRADMNALGMERQLNKVDIGEELPAIEARDAEARMSTIPRARISAIIQGMVDATTADEFLPED
jgi:hypothetical protein